MRKATARDIEYIENRLLAPAVACSDAIERMREVGFGEIAEGLAEALAEFTDHCRASRLLITVARQEEAMLR